jgi:hypothetical protein
MTWRSALFLGAAAAKGPGLSGWQVSTHPVTSPFAAAVSIEPQQAPRSADHLLAFTPGVCAPADADDSGQPCPILET